MGREGGGEGPDSWRDGDEGRRGDGWLQGRRRELDAVFSKMNPEVPGAPGAELELLPLEQ